jgi:hypothetical protein
MAENNQAATGKTGDPKANDTLYLAWMDREVAEPCRFWDVFLLGQPATYRNGYPALAALVVH